MRRLFRYKYMFCGDVGGATYTVPRFLLYVLPCYLLPIHSRVCVWRAAVISMMLFFFFKRITLICRRVRGHLLTHHKKSFPCQLSKTKWALRFDLIYEEQIYNYLKEECGGGSKQGRRDRFLKREEWQAENYKEETSFHFECPDWIGGHGCAADVTFREGVKITRSRTKPGGEAIKMTWNLFWGSVGGRPVSRNSVRRTRFKIGLVNKRSARFKAALLNLRPRSCGVKADLQYVAS